MTENQVTTTTTKTKKPTQQVSEPPRFKFPTETIDLPSKGLVYPSDNPLSSGKVEMKYMTAREEDIITNQNYIQKGVVVDKLLESLIVSDISYRDLIVGDKNALLVAARVLGYGKDYKFNYLGEDYEVDLTTIDPKEIDESDFTQGINEFPFTLPHSETEVTFRLMTEGLEKKIEQELRGHKKLKKAVLPEMSTRMKYLILSVDGIDERKEVRDFVDNYLLARDAKALRDHIVSFQPDLDFTFERETATGEIIETDIPITSNFFFPND